MKRALTLGLMLILMVCLSACSGAASAKTNPLADKTYEPLVIDQNTDFLDFFNSICLEYSGHIDDFAYYLEKHTDELENKAKSFSDFDDYESSLNGYYQFLNSIMYCESDNVPEEYQKGWSLVKTTVWKNKSDLDSLYSLKGQELVSAMSEMLSYIQVGIEEARAAMPNAIVKSVALGDTISLDFVEMTLEEIGVSETILPVDTSRVYSYISDTPNEKYFYLTGTLKNLSGNTYDVEDIFAQMVFDGTYSYSAYLTACAWSNNFYDESVKPLGTVKYYIYASIPDELINSYGECEIKFGFANDFSVSRYRLTEGECNHLFTLIDQR